MSGGEKRFLGEVLPIAWAFRDLLAPACQQIEIVGSIRRQAERVGDIEIAALPHTFDGKNALHWLLDELLQQKVVAKAQLGESGQTKWGTKYRAVMYQGNKVDVFICSPLTYIPTGLIIRTGSADAIKYLMQQIIYRKAPFRFQDGCVWYGDEPLLLDHESKFFGLMGMPFTGPRDRTLAEFQNWFNRHWVRWGDPKKYLPVRVQRALPGAFNALMNEVYTKRDEDEAKAAVKAVVIPPYEWRAPWVNAETDKVWIRNGYQDGQPHFILVDRFSPAGEKQRALLARQMHSGFYGSETDELWQFLLDGKWLAFPDFVDLPPYLIEPYIDETRAVKRTVNPFDIIPTKKEVDAWETMLYFRRAHSQRDDRNRLPYGLMFRGSDQVYMTDGHHRLMAARQYGRTVFEIEVQRVPVTLDELLHGIPPQEVDYGFLADMMEEALNLMHEVQYA